MHTGHTHIVKPHHFAAQDLCGQSGFLCHRNITGSSGGDHHLANAAGRWDLADNTYFCIFVIIQQIRSSHICRSLCGHSCNQNPFLTVFLHGIDDACDLFRGFACSIDHFCSALADLSVQVNLGISDILKGSFLDFQQGIIHGSFTGPNGFQELSDITVHLRTSRSSNTLV